MGESNVECGYCRKEWNHICKDKSRLAQTSLIIYCRHGLDVDCGQVSCHPQHRTLAASWLHPSLSSSPVPPVLDGLPLTRQEVAMVGSSRLLAPPMPSPPPSSTVEEEHRSVSREGSIVTSLGGSVRRRKKKVREAVILDQPTINSEETRIKVEVEVAEAPSSSCYKDELLDALKKSQSVESYGGESRLEELLGITDKTPEKLPERELVPEEIPDRLKTESTEPVSNPEIKTEEDLIEKAHGEPDRLAVCDLSTGIYGERGERETSPQVKTCMLGKIFQFKLPG